jgi:hypothetical protein
MTRLMTFAFAVLVGLLAVACGSMAGGVPSTSLQDVASVEQFQARFAQDLGRPRLVILVSPT